MQLRFSIPIVTGTAIICFVAATATAAEVILPADPFAASWFLTPSTTTPPTEHAELDTVPNSSASSTSSSTSSSSSTSNVPSSTSSLPAPAPEAPTTTETTQLVPLPETT